MNIRAHPVLGLSDGAILNEIRVGIVVAVIGIVTVAVAVSNLSQSACAWIRPDVHLTVNEELGRFDKRIVRIGPGAQNFTVEVPESARGRHGVAIDGGTYHRIEGAAVSSEKTTTLTVDLKPGKYTIYDPFGTNRDDGFVARVIVADRYSRNPWALPPRPTGC